MIRRVYMAVLFPVILAALYCSLEKAGSDRVLLTDSGLALVRIPAPMLRLLAGEYKGLVADFMLLRSMTFIGESSKRIVRPQVSDDEWRQLYEQLDIATRLDPHFFDLYYFANAHLTWGGRLVEETNQLLARGAKARDWDNFLPFFLGFNQFFFLEQYAEAAESLMESSRRPGGNPALALLASRLAQRGRRTENSILFMKELLRDTQDPDLRHRYQERLVEFESLFRVETAVSAFYHLHGRYPSDWKELFGASEFVSPEDSAILQNYFIDEKGVVRRRVTPGTAHTNANP